MKILALINCSIPVDLQYPFNTVLKRTLCEIPALFAYLPSFESSSGRNMPSLRDRFLLGGHCGSVLIPPETRLHYFMILSQFHEYITCFSEDNI
jgi:hypothetical protein